MDIPSWIAFILQQWETMKVLHPRYVTNVRQLQLALLVTMPGEVITLVGPSRVGKSKSLKEALALTYPASTKHHKPVVVVEGENASIGGEFSTKAFAVQCLRAIEHPMFCTVKSENPMADQYKSRVHRATEGVLRDAFEAALLMCGTKVLVIDEAHHFGYARGGPVAAARILDSLKCLANKTQVKLILAGSYRLLDLLALAPHLLGRQHPLEFPRYRTSNSEDVMSWRQILTAFGQGLLVEKSGDCLQAWGKLLFDGSFGCVGHLSRWLRACLAYTVLNELPSITRPSLLATRLPDMQADELVAEILEGERSIARGGEARCLPDKLPEIPRRLKKIRSRPFQKKARRSPRGGRS